MLPFSSHMHAHKQKRITTSSSAEHNSLFLRRKKLGLFLIHRKTITGFSNDHFKGSKGRSVTWAECERSRKNKTFALFLLKCHNTIINFHALTNHYFNRKAVLNTKFSSWGSLVQVKADLASKLNHTAQDPTWAGIEIEIPIGTER